MRRTVVFPSALTAVFLCLLGFAPELWGHPVSILDVEMDVNPKEVSMEVAIMAEDLLLSRGELSMPGSSYSADQLLTYVADYGARLEEGIFLGMPNGRQIRGAMIGYQESKNWPRGEMIPYGSLMQYTIVFTMEYLLPTEKPEALQFVCPLLDPDSLLPTECSVMVLREGRTLDRFQLINRQTQAIDLKWDVELKVKPLKPDELASQQMGLSSYSAVYAYVYLEDFEVRLELLIPFATLETMVDIPRSVKTKITVEEQNAARDELERFSREMLDVHLDGLKVNPVLSRVDFYSTNIKDFAMQAPRRELASPRARVGMILTYPSKVPIGKAAVRFGLFNQYVQDLRCNLLTDESVEVKRLTPEDPGFQWEREGEYQRPDIRIAGVDDAEPTDSEAAAYIELLLQNIYRAFDYRNESDVYDALQTSVDGELLTRLYLQIRRGLVMQEQGGAVARVRQVEVALTESKPLPEDAPRETPGFGMRAEWSVSGTVEHWGHIHERMNQYEAMFVVQAVDGAWKITDMQPKKQVRVRTATEVRKITE